MITIKSNTIVAFLLLPLLYFFAADSLSAASLQYYENKIYQAYVKDDMDTWKNLMNQMEDKSSQLSKAKFLLHYTLTQYGYVGYLIGTDKENQAEKLIQNTLKNANKLTKTKYKAEAWALKSGLNGFEIGLAKYKAPVLGHKSKKYIDKSLSIKTRNPMAWLEKGNIYYHMPGLFGGSYDKAIRYYKKAIGYFKHTSYLPSWLKLNTMVWLGKTYEANNQFRKSAETYRNILRHEPDFKWVKNDLLPEVKKNLQ